MSEKKEKKWPQPLTREFSRALRVCARKVIAIYKELDSRLPNDGKQESTRWHRKVFGDGNS